MFGLGAGELIIILILALIVFGPGKLPDVGRAVGRAMSEFKKAASDWSGDENGKSAKAPDEKVGEASSTKENES